MSQRRTQNGASVPYEPPVRAVHMPWAQKAPTNDGQAHGASCWEPVPAPKRGRVVAPPVLSEPFTTPPRLACCLSTSHEMKTSPSAARGRVRWRRWHAKRRLTSERRKRWSSRTASSN